MAEPSVTTNSTSRTKHPPSPPNAGGTGETSRAERAERARNGSNRKRDLDALAAEEGTGSRAERLEWARQHFPDFGDRIVLHALSMAERRPGAEGYTVDSVRAELDEMRAEPLQERGSV